MNYELYKNIEHSGQLPPELIPGIIASVRAAFGEAPEDTAEHLHGDRFIVAKDGEKVVGFASAELVSLQEKFGSNYPAEVDGIYLSAAAIDQEYQGKGIYSELNSYRLNEAINRHQAPHIFTRTQNPRVEKGIQQYLDSHRYVEMTFLKRILVPGCYGQMLTKDRPTVSDPEIQVAYDQLDYQAGDAYVLVFKPSYRYPVPMEPEGAAYPFGMYNEYASPNKKKNR